MKLIKLHYKQTMSYLNIEGMLCFREAKYENKICNSSMFVGSQWLFWEETIDEILEKISDFNINLIKLTFSGKKCYVNVDKISCLMPNKNPYSHNSKTLMDGIWFDWEESIGEIIDLIKKNNRKIKV